MSTPTGSSSSRQVSEADNRREDPMDTSDLARPLPQSSSPVPPSGNLKANHSFHFFCLFHYISNRFNNEIQTFKKSVFHYCLLQFHNFAVNDFTKKFCHATFKIKDASILR